MSISESSQILQGVPDGAIEAVQEEPKRKFDVKALVSSRTFQLAALTFAAVLFCFWPLIPREILKRWTDMEGYYAHGFLIPLCSAYLIWEKWPRIKDIPVKTNWWVLALIIPVLYVSLAASRCIMPTLLSGLLVMTLLLGVLLIAGWRWLMVTAAPILFLFMGLPVFDKIIDRSTMPLQLISSKIAYVFMSMIGLQPYRGDDPTVMYVPNFSQQLQVAAACSGLRTTIAIFSAVFFFIFIARLSWWKNIILAVVAIPLSMVVNGLRIGLIGLAANTWPGFANDNFQSMHDTSGYVALAICFVLLGWLTRKMGYK